MNLHRLWRVIAIAVAVAVVTVATFIPSGPARMGPRSPAVPKVSMGLIVPSRCRPACSGSGLVPIARDVWRFTRQSREITADSREPIAVAD